MIIHNREGYHLSRERILSYLVTSDTWLCKAEFSRLLLMQEDQGSDIIYSKATFLNEGPTFPEMPQALKIKQEYNAELPT